MLLLLSVYCTMHSKNLILQMRLLSLDIQRLLQMQSIQMLINMRSPVVYCPPYLPSNIMSPIPKRFSFILCVGVLCLYVSMCSACVTSGCRVQKRAPDHLQLELRATESHHEGAWNRTQVSTRTGIVLHYSTISQAPSFLVIRYQAHTHTRPHAHMLGKSQV